MAAVQLRCSVSCPRSHFQHSFAHSFNKYLWVVAMWLWGKAWNWVSVLCQQPLIYSRMSWMARQQVPLPTLLLKIRFPGPTLPLIRGARPSPSSFLPACTVFRISQSHHLVRSGGTLLSWCYKACPPRARLFALFPCEVLPDARSPPLTCECLGLINCSWAHPSRVECPGSRHPHDRRMGTLPLIMGWIGGH